MEGIQVSSLSKSIKQIALTNELQNKKLQFAHISSIHPTNDQKKIHKNY